MDSIGVVLHRLDLVFFSPVRRHGGIVFARRRSLAGLKMVAGESQRLTLEGNRRRWTVVCDVVMPRRNVHFLILNAGD